MKSIGKTSLFITLTCTTLLVTGCLGEPQRVGYSSSGDARYEQICIDKVEYLYMQTGHGKQLAGHFKPDGSLYTCEGYNE